MRGKDGSRRVTDGHNTTSDCCLPALACAGVGSFAPHYLKCLRQESGTELASGRLLLEPLVDRSRWKLLGVVGGALGAVHLPPPTTPLSFFASSSLPLLTDGHRSIATTRTLKLTHTALTFPLPPLIHCYPKQACGVVGGDPVPSIRTAMTVSDGIVHAWVELITGRGRAGEIGGVGLSSRDGRLDLRIDARLAVFVCAVGWLGTLLNHRRARSIDVRPSEPAPSPPLPSSSASSTSPHPPHLSIHPSTHHERAAVAPPPVPGRGPAHPHGGAPVAAGVPHEDLRPQ